MPTLKHLSCSLEWGNTGIPFQEYCTKYDDGVVETWIAIPEKPQPFVLRLTSKCYIAEGLAMIVFVDGEYHCNRNRTQLKPLRKGAAKEETVINFLLRQKESPRRDGTYWGREWRFDDVNIVPSIPTEVDRNHFEDIGVIEVLVLRCSGQPPARQSLTTPWAYSDYQIRSMIPGPNFSVDNPDAARGAPPDVSSDDDSTGSSSPGKQSSGETLFGDQEQGNNDDIFRAMPGMFWTDGTNDQPFPQNGRGAGPSGGHPGQASTYNQNSQGFHPNNPAWAGRGAPGQQFSPATSTGQHMPRIQPMTAQYSASQHVNMPKRVHFELGQGPNPPHYMHNWPSSGYGGQTNYDSYPSYREEVNMPGAHRHRQPQGPEVKNPMSQSDGFLGECDVENSRCTQFPNLNRYNDFARSHIYSRPQPQLHPSLLSFPSIRPAGHPYSHGPIPGMYPYSHPAPPNLGVPDRQTGMGSSFPPYQSQESLAPGMDYHQANNSNQYYGAGGWPGPPGSLQGEACNADVPQQGAGHPNFTGGQWNPTQTNEGWANTGQPASGGPGSMGGVAFPGWPGSLPPRKDFSMQGTNNEAGIDRVSVTNDDPPKDAAEEASDEENDGLKQDAYGPNQNSNWENSDQQPPEDQAQASWGAAQGSSGPTVNDWANDTTNQQNTTQNSANAWEQANVSQPAAANSTWNMSTAPAAPTAPTANSLASANPTRPLFGPHGVYYSPVPLPSVSLDFGSEEEAKYDLPQDFVDEFAHTKQVQCGRGWPYVLPAFTPQYLDAIQEPYARFTFQYRTRAGLKQDANTELRFEPSPEQGKQQFEVMDKDELIEMVMRAQHALGGKIPSPTPPARPDQAKPAPAQARVFPPPDKSFLGGTFLENSASKDNHALGNTPAANAQMPPQPVVDAPGAPPDAWAATDNWGTHAGQGEATSAPAGGW